MNPEYVARKSAWSVVNLLKILLCLLIIPLFKLLADIWYAKSFRFEFYKDHIIVKSGILNKKEKRTPFEGVLGVEVEQSLRGRLFGYGDIKVDAIGKWDIGTKDIKNPAGLKKYLETRIVSPKDVTVAQAFVK